MAEVSRLYGVGRATGDLLKSAIDNEDAVKLEKLLDPACNSAGRRSIS